MVDVGTVIQVGDGIARIHGRSLYGWRADRVSGSLRNGS